MKIVKPLKKNKSVFDIILYGSIANGAHTPHDVDIAVIFHCGSLKEQLEVVQNMKKQMKVFGTVDCKALLWDELFAVSNFSRSGIFLEGISLFSGKQFSQKIGFVCSVLFVYMLKNKKHSEKVKFNYILAGRNGKGMIERLQGKHVAPGVVEIPIKHSLEFEEVLKLHKIDYEMKKILVEE
jgi:hypothetical protein